MKLKLLSCLLLRSRKITSTENKFKKEPVKPVMSNVERYENWKQSWWLLKEELPEDIINFLKRDHFELKPSE